jgi:ABC-2 type transport system ATP-binding protein
VPWEGKNEFKRNISIVLGQKNQLWWDLPANESLYLNKCIYNISDNDYHKTLDELSELLDVKELLDVQVRNLSLGERMKMELLAALIHKPKVIFLDEPTIGLDMIAQKNIRDFLKYYNMQEKITIMLTSHYLEDIEALCQRTIVINNGSLVYDGKDIPLEESLEKLYKSR